MPTYQYACTECGDQLEAVQSFSDPALTECPACGGRLRKVFSSVGVVFKGSGFYRNDSRPSANGDKANGDKADGGSSTTESTKSEKPAASSSDSSSAPATGSSTSSGPGSSGTKAAAATSS